MNKVSIPRRNLGKRCWAKGCTGWRRRPLLVQLYGQRVEKQNRRGRTKKKKNKA
jgi:hypothetical protein